MSVEKIITEWKKKQFKPIYWLEGEEPYFIDKIVQYAEHQILSEADASFNLSVFYGKDANWADVVNACMRYPMLAERQVVLLKEAQQMSNIEKLENYIEKPLASTVFVVSYKDKKLDARTKFAKLVQKQGEVLTTKKMYENQLPQWTNELVQSKGYSITPKGLALIVDHIGNDLSMIDHAIDKLLVNLGDRKSITEDDIEKYVGVSKEYNVFELQDAFGKKDLAKAMRIIQYFESNPKAAPIQLILPSLYNFFSKVFMLFSVMGKDDKTVASSIGVSPFFVKDYIAAAQRYQYEGAERVLMLLHEYNLKSVGVNNSGTPEGSLLKEMTVKAMM